ncbi:MAG: carbohydrate transporter rane protein 1, family [Oscillospiraceae bacterium]|jgi:ABC-type sugar transport system permease subunit|nr:carbohydrate transporter rane protein 1, family [Oscillospiraceae bacterium]
MKKKKGLSLTQRQKLMGLYFVAPWVIGFLLFFAYNLVEAVVFSFSKIKINDGGGFSITWAGIENYRYALRESADFVRRLTESMGSILIDVPLITFFSLFIAILLNRKFKGRALVRAIFFLPVIMASAAINDTLNSNLEALMGGMSNTAAAQVTDTTATGLNAMVFAGALMDFGMPNQVIEYLVGAVSRLYEIIRSSGVQIIIFLAALQAISPSLYEVAQIEGATSYETFWKITFPMVSPLILTNVVYTIIDLYSQSDIVEVAHTTAFTSLDFGLGAAMSVISSLCVCAILGIVSFLISKKVFYQS